MPRVAFFGAPPDTPNLGVSALFESTLSGLSEHIDNLEVVLFDNNLGRRDETIEILPGKPVKLIRFGARGGHRYYRPENLLNMYFASALGPVGAFLNEGIRLIDSCDVVLDISGGDSFSDIYGRKRFDCIYRPKAIAVNRKKPLVLLPQTFGPYNDPAVRNLAKSVICDANMVWSRDLDSHEKLKQLLGSSFNPDIHRVGVDMAFGLRPAPVAQLLPPVLNEWLTNKLPTQPLVGFNVSGLIYNDPESASSRYGFKLDYGKLVVELLQSLLEQTNCSIVLIPHVLDNLGHYESDLAACENVARKIGVTYKERVLVCPITLNASQVKMLISAMDWFCGTRMHSTIAALSSGVACASISYSDKTKGVFETCGQAELVFDPRSNNVNGIREGLHRAFVNHASTKVKLAAMLPRIASQLVLQNTAIADLINAGFDNSKLAKQA